MHITVQMMEIVHRYDKNPSDSEYMKLNHYCHRNFYQVQAHSTHCVTGQ